MSDVVNPALQALVPRRCPLVRLVAVVVERKGQRHPLPFAWRCKDRDITHFYLGRQGPIVTSPLVNLPYLSTALTSTVYRQTDSRSRSRASPHKHRQALTHALALRETDLQNTTFRCALLSSFFPFISSFLTCSSPSLLLPRTPPPLPPVPSSRALFPSGRSVRAPTLASVDDRSCHRDQAAWFRFRFCRARVRVSPTLVRPRKEDVRPRGTLRLRP